MVQLSHLSMTTGKTIGLTIQTSVGKVMSLLFNTLSSFVIAFLPRSKHLLISWLQSPSTVILEPKKIKSVPVFAAAAAAAVKSLQSCPTLCNPMDYTAHGILQLRVLEWVAVPSPGNLPNPGIEPRSPALQADSLSTELKKAESLRIGAFELYCWRRLLRVPLRARR